MQKSLSHDQVDQSQELRPELSGSTDEDQKAAEVPGKVISRNLEEALTLWGPFIGGDVETPANPKNKEPLKSRGWCLRKFEPNNRDIHLLRQMNEQSRYMCGILERGKKTGRVHWHIFVYYENEKKKCELVNKLRDGWRVEKMIDQKGAIKYATKMDETMIGLPFEEGRKPEQGRKRTLVDVCDQLKKGKKLQKVAEDDPLMIVKHGKGLAMLYGLLQKDREGFAQFSWLYGESGLGKTSYIYSKWNKEDVYSKKDNGKDNWDGYDQQEVILLDEFRGNMDIHELLQLTDRYKFQLNVKYSSAKCNSKFIFVSTEHPPEYYYNGTILNQLCRRIHESGGEIIHFPGKAKQYTDLVKRRTIGGEIIEPTQVNQLPPGYVQGDVYSDW